MNRLCKIENVAERERVQMQGFAATAKGVSENADNQAKALGQIETGNTQISLVTQQNAAAPSICAL